MILTNEKIMEIKGWKCITNNSICTFRQDVWHDKEGHIAYIGNGLPNWTGKLSDSWELVEEMMTTDGTSTVFSVMLSTNHEVGYQCIVNDCEKGDLIYWGKTAPLAICEAYAKWKGA